MKKKLRYWWLRTYYRLFHRKEIIKFILQNGTFKSYNYDLGDTFYFEEGNYYLYVGKNYMIKIKPENYDNRRNNGFV